MPERRPETRYTVPEIYQEHITLKTQKDSGEFVAAKLVNISLRGIKIKDQFALAVGSMIECSISIPESITKEVPFSAKVSYCIEDKVDGNYLIGAEITRTSEQLWVDIFLRVHDFIDASLRMSDTE
jgi:hypothetical protein